MDLRHRDQEDDAVLYDDHVGGFVMEPGLCVRYGGLSRADFIQMILDYLSDLRRRLRSESLFSRRWRDYPPVYALCPPQAWIGILQNIPTAIRPPNVRISAERDHATIDSAALYPNTSRVLNHAGRHCLLSGFRGRCYRRLV